MARVADRHGYHLRRLVSIEPQEHSPFVADLYRWWYRRLGRPSNRLLAESYVQWDPMMVLKTGSIPFWSRFKMEPAYDELKSYLEHSEPYDEILVNLFSQGIESPGVAPVERWRALARQHARSRGEVIGVDEDTYPLDAGSTLRYHAAFEQIPERHPLPEPLTPEDVDRFVSESTTNYPVTWH